MFEFLNKDLNWEEKINLNSEIKMEFLEKVGILKIKKNRYPEKKLEF